MPKLKIRKIVFLVVLLASFYLLSQIIIYAFFAESKIVKIDTKPFRNEEKMPLPVEKYWLGNYIVLKAYTDLGCNTNSYARYNKNKIEVFSIEPNILCWGSAPSEIYFTLYFNNIISSTKAYLSQDELLIHNWCRIVKNNCIIDGSIITSHEQAKNYGFIELRIKKFK